MDDAVSQFSAALESALAALGLACTPAQVDAMSRHYAAMVEANRTFNLTRITEPVESAVKHYADSLAILRLIEDHDWRVESVLDIGTGAGFPSIPLAIMRRDWHITAIDGTGKKIDFVTRVAAELQLSNLHAVHAHSAHWEADAEFDVVTGRAIAKLREFVAQASRFVATGGRIVAYKSDPLPESETFSQLSTIGGLRSEATFHYQLQINGETLCRALHVYVKD